MKFILIDGSYFIYYRYFSLKNWWRNAKHIDESCIPFENARFIDKYRTTFTNKMAEIKELYSPNEKAVILVGKDCPSSDIWRRKLFAEYKHGRKNDDSGVGDSFKLTYTENLFSKGGANAILYDEELEADDCIAITVRHIENTYPESSIHIITSDMDYLQLVNDNVYIYNLQGKLLTDSKQSFNNPEKDLFCKIVSGDKSDNIQSVFARCGQKTAAKYYDDREVFKRKLELDPDANKLYERNREIIDFDYIPKYLEERFKKECLNLPVSFCSE